MRLVALGVSLALALAVTWPLAPRLATHYAVRNLYGPSADQLFTSWILAHDARALVEAPSRIFESNNLHPFPHTLAYSENLIGLALPILPVHLLWENPTLDHNVAMLLALTLSGFGTFLLVRALGGGTSGGLLSSTLVVYSPVVMDQLPLLHMLAGHLVPLALFALVRVATTLRWRWGLALGVALAAQTWTSLHHGLFLALGLAAGTPVLLATSRRARRLLGILAMSALVGTVLVLPLAHAYQQVGRDVGLARRGGAGRFSLRLATDLPALGSPLEFYRARLARSDRARARLPLTPWLLIGAGVVAGTLVPRRRHVDWPLLLALGAGAGANLLLALGPARDPWLPRLYPTLAHLVPAIAVLRAPLRAVAYTHLILCVFAGIAGAAGLRRLPRGPIRLTAVLGVVGVIAVEAGWAPLPLTAAPRRATPLAAALEQLRPGCAIAELPASQRSGATTLLRSTIHWRPVLTGYSGFHPISPNAIRTLLHEFPSDDARRLLAEAGVCGLVLRPPLRPDRRAALVAASRRAGLVVHEAGPEALVMVPDPPRSVPRGHELPRARWKLDASGAWRVLDGDLTTVWRARALTAGAPERLTVDLGDTATPGALRLHLGTQLRLYLRSYRVEGSIDGRAWTVLAERAVAIPPLRSYRADPTRVTQRIDLAPRAVRWIRFGPARRPPREGLAPDAGWAVWGLAELSIERAGVSP